MGYAEGVPLVAGVVTLAFATVYARSGHAIVGLCLALVTIPLHVIPMPQTLEPGARLAGELGVLMRLANPSGALAVTSLPDQSRGPYQYSRSCQISHSTRTAAHLGPGRF